MSTTTLTLPLRDLLHSRLATCHRELNQLLSLLFDTKVSPRLQPFALQLQAYAQHLLQETENLQKKLALPDPAILPEVLSATARLVRDTRLVHQRLSVPVLRYSSDDEIGLKVVLWLHAQHKRTKDIPAACTVGDTSILPVQGAPIYYMPSLERRGLLYLSLLFHEYGHLLFALYRQEMKDLIEEFQSIVESGLQQLSARNDSHSEAHAKRSKAIAERWFEWVHEFFCDALGLHLGGAAYLNAFSAYVSYLHPNDYTALPHELQGSSHPLSWLRIRVLAERARNLGLHDEADSIESEWKTVLDELSVNEDYYGYFNDHLKDQLQQTLDDMLVCVDFEPTSLAFGLTIDRCQQSWHGDASPAILMHDAWRHRMTMDATDYVDWERNAVEEFLRA